MLWMFPFDRTDGWCRFRLKPQFGNRIGLWPKRRKRRATSSHEMGVTRLPHRILGNDRSSRLFLILGSNMMYNTGGQFSTNAVTFASELIRLYTSSLGSWAYPIILLAAFFTMFSTTLTCFDAYPRVVANASQRVIPRLASVSREKLYWIWIVVVAFGSVGILAFFLTSMKGLVDFATTVSFWMHRS